MRPAYAPDSLHRLRIALFVAAFLFTSILPGNRLAASPTEGPTLKATPIPAAQIHETLIAEARQGSDIVAIRVSGTGAERRVAWLEETKGSKTVWLDGKQVAGPYDEVKYFAFRAQGGPVVVVATRKSKWTLKIGEQEYGGDYSKITAPDVGPEGQSLAGVCRDKTCRLMVDGHESGPVFEDIGTPDFSPKGEHMVYFGKRNGKWTVILDGKETGPEMDGWWTHRWWAGGSRLAVAAVLDGKSTWVVEGNPGPRFDVIGNIAFSADGQHYAYGGANAQSGFTKQDVVGSIVIDGTAVEPSFTGRGMLGGWTWLGGKGLSIVKGLKRLSTDFHGVSDPDFNGRGELVFGHRLASGQVAVRVGNDDGPTFDDLTSPIAIGPESEHIAYVGRKGDAFVEVRDQTPGVTFSAKRDIAMVAWIGLSKGGHLTYSTVLGGGEFKAGRSQRALRRVVFDGVAEAEYDAFGITPCLISIGGEQHVYVVTGADGTRDRLVVNGRETGLYDDVVSGSLNMLPPTGVEFVVRQERRLLLVTVDAR